MIKQHTLKIRERGVINRFSHLLFDIILVSVLRAKYIARIQIAIVGIN